MKLLVAMAYTIDVIGRQCGIASTSLRCKPQPLLPLFNPLFKNKHRNVQCFAEKGTVIREWEALAKGEDKRGRNDGQKGRNATKREGSRFYPSTYVDFYERSSA